ncbi:hypothetical protein OG754_18355 [Streptomyces decoyicus]|uniref:hypothetical protein n=1 Tax=Streptomyces decoyicus TaxID=249567 RepID=UPI002E334B0D|nr:hypothetical protein [Streptomyces decoyicus]
MSTRPHPPLEGQPARSTGLNSAEPASAPADSGAPKGGAEGVLSAVRPYPQQGDGRYPIAWLHVTAPGGGAIPTATSKCLCGRDRSAVGHRKVLGLIEEHHAHRTTCSFRRSGDVEKRNAA